MKSNVVREYKDTTLKWKKGKNQIKNQINKVNLVINVNDLN